MGHIGLIYRHGGKSIAVKVAAGQIRCTALAQFDASVFLYQTHIVLQMNPLLLSEEGENMLQISAYDKSNTVDYIGTFHRSSRDLTISVHMENKLSVHQNYWDGLRWHRVGACVSNSPRTSRYPPVSVQWHNEGAFVPNSHLASCQPNVSVDRKRQGVFKSPKVNWVDYGGTIMMCLYQTHTLLHTTELLAWTGRDKECLSHRRSTGSTTVAQLWCVPNSHLASYDPTVSVNMKRQAVFKSPKVNWVDCNGTAWCFCTKLAIIFHTTPSTSRQKEDI